MLKKAIKDIKLGRSIEASYGRKSRFDYSHLLNPITKRNFRLIVDSDETGTFHEARVIHRGAHAKAFMKVGSLEGYEDARTPGRLGIAVATIRDPEDRGKGLGTAMYEALYAHAYHMLGIREVAGDEHSSLAHHVHKKLAAKHGLKYNPKANYSEEWSPDKDEPGAWDHKYGPYKYRIK